MRLGKKASLRTKSNRSEYVLTFACRAATRTCSIAHPRHACCGHRRTKRGGKRDKRESIYPPPPQAHRNSGVNEGCHTSGHSCQTPNSRDGGEQAEEIC